tara:strand:- start:269 stop:1303 length:1035 start_codon:yes stop_codon:yes gene_type:complete
MSELEDILKNSNISDASKSSYRQAYKKLTGGLENDILNSSAKTILRVIPSLSNSLNSQQSYINIAILIFKNNNKKTDLLEAARESTKLKINAERNKGNAVKLASLPSKKELDDYLNKLFTDEDWRSYIINYLLHNNYVRNKDLNLLIVNKVGKDSDENYLVKRKYDVLYVRRDYKTKGTYGAKENQIKSAKLRKAVEELQKDSEQDKTPLLAKINGNRVDDSSIAKYIIARTFKKSDGVGLSESDIMKVNVNHIDKTGNIRKLKQMSEHRGTSIKTLIDNYNLNGFAYEDKDGVELVVNKKGESIEKPIETEPTAPTASTGLTASTASTSSTPPVKIPKLKIKN